MDVFSQGAAGGNGHRVDWTLDFNDTANTITIDAKHTRMASDGQGGFLPALAEPQRAWITVQLNTGQARTVDLVTGMIGVASGPLNDINTVLNNPQLFDGNAAEMLNSGPRVRTGVRLTVSADRAAMMSFSTQYKPPA